jgi:hypothetical protein
LAPFGEKKHMGSDCLKFICDYQKVNMTVNKRFDENLREAADKWYLRKQLDESMFGNSQDVKRFLCYTNRKRQQLNTLLMAKHKNPKRFLELPCALKMNKAGVTVVDQESQAMVISPGMPVICRMNCNKDGLAKNNESIVRNFNKKTKKILITHSKKIEGKEEFSYLEFTEYFNPSYAITIHKSQGETYTDPYCIAELDLIKRCREGRELLYVALTRAREIGLINLDTRRSTWADKCDQMYSKTYLQSKVKSYKQQDIAKNRHNDLTEEKVRQIIKESSNFCYYCRNRLTTKTFTLDRGESRATDWDTRWTIQCAAATGVTPARTIWR